jgi:hypothetical protein
LYATASAYFSEVNPEAFEICYSMDKDIEQLTAVSAERGLPIIKPDDGSEPLFALTLLQERFY